MKGSLPDLRLFFGLVPALLFFLIRLNPFFVFRRPKIFGYGVFGHGLRFFGLGGCINPLIFYLPALTGI